MRIAIPEFSLIVLIGVSGSGKSTFASRHFRPREILAADFRSGLAAAGEGDPAAVPDGSAPLPAILEARLRQRRLSVIDEANVRPEDRRSLLGTARRSHVQAVAIVLDPGESVCCLRNAARPGWSFEAHVVRAQRNAFNRGIGGIKREGFREVHHLRTQAEIDAVEVIRQPLQTDRRDLAGPFDIIGDVHGCMDELEALLLELGYRVERQERDGELRYVVAPPAGRRTVFVGDLVDRGPRIADTLRLAMDMVEDGSALAVRGNHEVKAGKWLQGRSVKVAHGLAQTIEELRAAGAPLRERAARFIDRLASYYLLDGARLAVAHAGIKDEMMGGSSAAIRSFCLFGETTGETDEFGLPVRYNWAAEYRGATKVVYGHTPVLEPEWLNNTLCVDTGCVFGGKLTALRYPETELVSVPAARAYAEPVRPLARPAAGTLSAQS